MRLVVSFYSSGRPGKQLIDLRVANAPLVQAGDDRKRAPVGRAGSLAVRRSIRNGGVRSCGFDSTLHASPEHHRSLWWLIQSRLAMCRKESQGFALVTSQRPGGENRPPADGNQQTGSRRQRSSDFRLESFGATVARGSIHPLPQVAVRLGSHTLRLQLKSIHTASALGFCEHGHVSRISRHLWKKATCVF